ncbi:hypothetical protein LSCM1_02604 [Leishmania martiniquensis]|uniref:Uncharacterized protein n=1 Tax=Leishmania martiniquensis TaxID=1580590 RepID=A0A836KEB1_9TRYP|nr:hypothetical protein LSCM1_02604 [Leishmania martiniquensis]
MLRTESHHRLPRGELRSTLPSLSRCRAAMSALGWALLLVCVVANPAVHAETTVNSVTCTVSIEGWCVGGSKVEIKGENLDQVASVAIRATSGGKTMLQCAIDKAAGTSLECTIEAEVVVKAGPYSLALVLSSADDTSSTEVSAGTLLLGALWGLEEVLHWTAGTNSHVESQSSDWPSTGDAWTLKGIFDVKKSYSMRFYYTDAEDAPAIPSPEVTCVSMKITVNTLTCNIVTFNNAMGMYRVLVQESDTKAILVGTVSLSSIAVNPSLPAVTRASGNCAENSEKCVTGASLTLHGINFNSRKVNYQKFFVSFTETQQSAILLTPTEVSKENITVTLTVAEGTPAGSYPVYVQVQVCMMEMLSPLQYVGNLVLKSGSAKGFNLDPPAGGCHECQGADGMSAGHLAATILAAIFGVLFLAVLVTLVIVCVRGTGSRGRLG